MADMNSINVTGRLTFDPELRYTQNGDPVGNLRIAINGFNDDDVVFIDVTVWGKSAESCANNLTKGRKVGVTGRLSLSNWEDNDGNKRQKLFITASNIQFLDYPEDTQGGNGGQANQGRGKSRGGNNRSNGNNRSQGNNRSRGKS
jgi:single-strand DNA-binding protein